MNKDPNKLVNLREELAKINGIEITSSFKNNIEITKKRNIKRKFNKNTSGLL